MTCHFSKFRYKFRCSIIFIELRRYAHAELKSKLDQIIKLERDRITQIRRKNKEKEHDENFLNSIYSGIRGHNDETWKISQYDATRGILFRGYSIRELLHKLPKLPGTKVPTVEGHLWLLMTGTIPSNDEMKSMMANSEETSIMPYYIEKLLRDSPPNKTDIELLSEALNMLKSKVVESYTQHGVFKEKYWQMILEDVMDLIARVPTIAAMVYNKLYRKRPFLPMHNPHLDWAANFAIKLGVRNNDFEDMMRLFMIIYSHNHESKFLDLGGSAMTDPFTSYSTSLKRLSESESEFTGKDTIPFLEKVKEQIGPNPTVEIMKEYLSAKYSNKTLPGFGQSTDKIDSRFECLSKFAKGKLDSDPLFITSKLVQQAVSENQKLKPNADFISPILFRFYGLKEPSFYPIIFSIARSLGLLTTYIWDRALGVSLEKNKLLNQNGQLISPKKLDSSCAKYMKSKVTDPNPQKCQLISSNPSDPIAIFERKFQLKSR